MAEKKKKTPPTEVKEPRAGKLSVWLDKPYRFELAFAAFLALGLAYYFRAFLFQPGSMLGGTDMITQGLQTRKIAVDAVRSGQGLPLWNPLSYCGIPYLGFLPGPLFFPTTLLYYLMPIHRAIGYSFIIMIFVGGMFTYLWIRELGLSKPAAGLSGLAYCFTGWVASTLQGGHDGRMFVILLTPLVFFLLERALKKRKMIYFLLMGAAVALQILSPQVLMMYFSSLALTAYFIFRLFYLYRDKTPLSAIFRLGIGYTLGFVLAISLPAIQFVPLLADQKLSHRQSGLGLGHEGYEYATQFSMHPVETLGLVVPGFSGEPEAYWSAADFKSHSEYMGLLPLFFAAIALACRRNRHTWFFAALGFVALIYNFGGFTPFFKLPYYLLPRVKDFRGPNMMFFVAAFSIITLAGYGLDYLIAGKGDKGDDDKNSPARGFKVLAWCAGFVLVLFFILGAGKSALPSFFSSLLPERIGQVRQPILVQYYPSIIRSALVSVLVAAIILGLAWAWLKGKLPLALFTAFLAVIAFTDLMRMDRIWLNVVDFSQYYSRDQMVEQLQKDTQPYRVFFWPWPGSSDYWDNSLLYFDIPTINASMPLRLKWYEELMGTHLFNNLVRSPRLWDMLNTRYVYIIYRNSAINLGSVQLKPGEFQPLYERSFPFFKKVMELKYSAGSDLPKKVLYENANAWPRFRLFTKFEINTDDKKFVERFNDPSFDYLSTMILSEDPEFDKSRLDGAQPQGIVNIDRYSNDALELSVECDRPVLLYAAESYHPSWKADVDGAPARIYRANLAMRAVFLDQGKHKVTMKYVSRPFIWGRRLSILALVVLAVSVGLTLYRKGW